MPRRAPGDISSQLRLRETRHHSRTVIRGLSASANRQIRDFERRHGLPYGDTALAFQRWSKPTRRTRDTHEWRYGSDDVHTDHVRSRLEQALRHLRRKARRELRTALEPVDARALRWTVNDPFAIPWLPWWLRRIEI
ncbi:hypothetical protein AB0M43_28690 [Longispora sp. NPDC051575]|uniref:hypothetical protein n=1 Tax=Longispora sp. NPDC051575 TaxID=3154943 RepID=UPI003444B292